MAAPEPKKLLTRPFASGCPTANANQRGITVSNHRYPRIILRAKKPYSLLLGLGENKNELNLLAKDIRSAKEIFHASL
jgi:hypothetical protein